MKKKYPYNVAFTLVELIVVIMILAVLSTIAFISFQGYTQNSRDSVRLADMSSIQKGLNIKISKAEPLPIPDDKIDITASGTLLTYQGYAGQQVLGQISINGEGKDPLDNNYYTLGINEKRNKYQLLGFFESNDLAFLSNKTYANLIDRFPKIKGDNLGIIIHSLTQEPIQNENNNIDIVNTINEYSVLLDNSLEGNFTGNGEMLFSKLYNLRSDLSENLDLIKLDKSLILSLDMETTINDGGLIKLKDFSFYEKKGVCKNNNIDVDCGVLGQGPQVVNNQMFFDGIDDYIYFDSTNNFQNIFGNHNFTIMLKMNSGGDHISSIIGQRYGDEMNLFQYPDGKISLNMDDTRWGSVKSLSPVEYEKSVVVTFKYNGENSETQIFIDGVQSNNNGSSWDGSGASGSQTDLFIGWQSRQESGFPGFYYGFLDNIRIYKRVLSNKEIKNIYENKK